MAASLLDDKTDGKTRSGVCYLEKRSQYTKTSRIANLFTLIL